MTTDLYRLMGGSMGDALNALDSLLNTIDTVNGDPEGNRVILLICHALVGRMIHERESCNRSVD